MTPAVIDVAAALIFRRGQLLITQRYPGAHLGGLWEFPGGKVEPGESFPQCLRRELREELGIDVVVEEKIEAITHHYPEKTVHLQFFRCRLGAIEPQPLGCPDFRWIPPDQLPHIPFPPADARLLSKLLSSPNWWQPT